MTSTRSTADVAVTYPAPRSSAYVTGWVLVGIAAGMGITYGLARMHRLPLVEGTTAMTPATSIGVAVLCYLAAAATGVRWVSWVGVFVFPGLAFAGLLDVLPWYVLMALAGLLLLLVGVLAGHGRTSLVQAAAMAGYFGVSVLALFLAPRAGLVLAGLALAAHAVWDRYHYRRDIVVSRSMAVFCIGLDLTVALVCLVVAITF